MVVLVLETRKLNAVSINGRHRKAVYPPTGFSSKGHDVNDTHPSTYVVFTPLTCSPLLAVGIDCDGLAFFMPSTAIGDSHAKRGGPQAEGTFDVTP